LFTIAKRLYSFQKQTDLLKHPKVEENVSWKKYPL